uniref:Uncharacterized protein n=1 Tax=Arundo donax TaxID=35708 RepID=A0A0A9ALD3_ARUDO
MKGERHRARVTNLECPRSHQPAKTASATAAKARSTCLRRNLKSPKERTTCYSARQGQGHLPGMPRR